MKCKTRAKKRDPSSHQLSPFYIIQSATGFLILVPKDVGMDWDKISIF